MTRKDYVRIAGAVSDASRKMALEALGDVNNTDYADGMRAARSLVVTELCRVLRSDNPNFNEEKFRTYCLG